MHSVFSSKNIEPSIKIERMFNYCQKVTYTDRLGAVTGIVEDAPDFSTHGILSWENEFDTSEERKKALIAKLVEYLDAKGIKHTIFYGQSR